MKIGNICKDHPELKGMRYNDGNCSGCYITYKEKYRKDNPEKHRESCKKWREKNRDKHNAMSKIWQKENPIRVRDNNLRRIGFTFKLFNQALNIQNNKCAICSIDFRTLPKKSIHADHCHITNKPRGILCQNCNSGLGHFFDSIPSLKGAIEYLRNSPLDIA